VSVLEGVDLSYSNATTNTFAKFYIVKATQGTAKDPRWDQHSANVRKMGKPLAAYHFLVKGVPIIDQMTAFLAVASGADGFALDWEADPPSKAATRDAVRLVQAAGKKCGFYASDAVFFNAGQDWDWIAHYGTNKWPTFAGKRADIWQYQGHPLDRDRYDGTTAELLHLWGKPLPKPPPGDDEMFPISVPTPAKAGTIDAKADVELFALKDGAINDQHPAIHASATSADHDVPGGTAGFIFTGTSGTTYWIRATDATFTEGKP
jgi:hypothetical protein